MQLVERENSLRQLNAAWDQARESGCLALVCGEAGIGKTTLVEHFLRAKEGQARRLWGACDALFTPRPLGPLHDMAAQTGGDLPHLLTEDGNRVAIFAAFLQELGRGPTIAVVEDIHWADEATLDLLKYVGRRAHLTRALLVVTYRDDELGPRHPLRLLLGDLARSPVVQRVAPPPLSIAGVQQLAGERQVDAAALQRQTAGNPFYLTEALASGDEGVPPTVRDAVLARAARLSLSGRAVLDAAAVVGPRIEPWLLAEVTRSEADAVAESLDIGMLQAQNKVLAFRHELARQVILDALPPHRRTFLHQATLDALRQAPAAVQDLSRLAHHAEGAADAEAILTYGRAAAKEASDLGMNRAAARLYALVLRHAGDLPVEEQIDLYENYAVSAQGDPTRAETIAARRRAAQLACDAGLPVRQGYNLAVLSTALDMVDRSEEGARILDEALAILEPLAPNRGLVAAYKNLAYRHLQQGDPHTAVSYAQKSLDMAHWTEKEHVIIGAHQVLGLCWLPLDHERGCEALEYALAMALENDVYWTAAATYPNLTMTYVDIFRLQRAAELASAGITFTAEHDMDVSNQVLRGWQAMIALYAGRWDEAETQVAALLNTPDIHPYAYTPARLARGRILARKGDSDAQHWLDEALAGLHKSGNQQRYATAHTARAEAAWLAGDLQRARDEAHAVYDFAIENKQPSFAAELAYWLWQAGESVETYDWMLRPFVLEIEGHWREAAAEWAHLGCPYEQARALAAGDPDAQKEALVIFEQLGAQPLAERTRSRLRDAGVQTIPRGPRPDTRENPFGLTNRQIQVLQLLVDDLTNAEIAARLHIAPKTVDHHVSAILARLEVSSRDHAAALARQHPDL